MGATLASLPTAVWAQFLSGESASGGGVDLGQQQQQQQQSRASSDAFHQCCGSPPPLSQHWEAAGHDMDYPSPHPRYMMGPPPPNALISSNSGSNNHVGLSNNHWATNSGEPGHHAGLLQAEQHQYSDYQEPFATHIMANAHVNHLQLELPEESREMKRSAALTLGHADETSSSDVYKRPRLEPATAASVPFKAQVRKEKLGERITALQQLVSPFGKTDTASVLLEAIGYIKFLQDQVQVLSTPYMKPNVSSGGIIHHDSRDLHGKMCSWPSAKVKNADDVRQDLRSRGLCLVPVSCTLQVANDNGADFWTPAIGGSCR